MSSEPFLLSSAGVSAPVCGAACGEEVAGPARAGDVPVSAHINASKSNTTPSARLRVRFILAHRRIIRAVLEPRDATVEKHLNGLWIIPLQGGERLRRRGVASRPIRIECRRKVFEILL